MATAGPPFEPRSSPLLPDVRLLAGITLAWLAFGLVGGTVEYLTVLGPRGYAPGPAIGGPLLAAVIWIGLTVAARAAALRWPVWPPRAARIALHSGLAVASSFVLNAIWYVLAFATGLEALAPAELAPAAIRASLRFVHMNAGAYVVVVLLATLWERRSRGRRDAIDAVSKRQWTHTLSVRTGNGTRIVPVEEIVWIEGAGDYARLHLSDGSRILHGERLKRLASRLDPAAFSRVHRSAIVRRDRIRSLTHRSHGDYDAVLEDGTTVRVSRSYRDAIAHLLR